MGLMDWLLGAPPAEVEVERADPVLSLAELQGLLSSFSYNGIRYTLPTSQQEDVGGGFEPLVNGAFKSNAVVYACIANRLALFTEMRFSFRRLRSAGPAGLFANPDLRLLETPWEGATTGDLLARMLLHHDIAGNAYVVRAGDRLTPLRPDWVTIIGGTNNPDSSVWATDARVLGYAYEEGGPGGGKDPQIFLPEQVAHFASMPDPMARFRGMSWLTPVVREVMADKAATDHKLAFFENSATPNLAVKLDINDLEKFKGWIEEFKKQHQGVSHAYETMFLAAGADVTVIGKDLQQLEFKVTQGAGETRIAAAAGVPPVVVGLSEGLAAATYSNYAQARRRFADNTIRPLWRNVCGSLQRVVRTPSDAQLWYDDRDVSALQEDKQDAAKIQQTQALSIKTLVDAGFTAESAVKAVQTEDWGALQHTGLFSVQMQPPGTDTPPDSPANGNGDMSSLALTS